MSANSEADPTKETVTTDVVFTRITVGFTVAYMFAVAVLLFGGHLGKFTKMTPNTWGDLTAGVFAPLAWAWLAVGYHLQRLELIEQRLQITAARKAAEDQAEEQRNQAIAMANLVKVTASQSEVAKRQLYIQERNIRIGTRPRFYVYARVEANNTMTVTVRNDGASAYELAVSVSGLWFVSQKTPLGNLVDIGSGSSLVFVLEPLTPEFGDPRLHLRMPLSEVFDIEHIFAIRPNQKCELVDRGRVRVV